MQTGAFELTEEQANALLREYSRRVETRKKKAGAASPLLSELYPKQRAYIEDVSRLKALLGTRRAGKTRALGIDMSHAAAQARANDCLYLNPTAKQARIIMWDGPEGLKRIDERHNLGMHFNNQQMTAVLPSGARIICSGAETESDIEQYRGVPFKRVVVDEAGSFKSHLEALIMDVLQPGTADLQGTITLSGTPPKILAGLFYDAIRPDEYRNEAWSLHQLSILDNPFIPHALDEMAMVRVANKWDKYFEATGQEHPSYRREWLGECVRELSSLVYKFPGDGRGYYRTLPPAVAWNKILGIDLGWSADTAFREIMYSDEHPQAFAGEEFAAPNLTVTSIGQKIMEMDKRAGGYEAIVADPGALGQNIIADINERFGLSIKPAEKQHKGDFIEMMNDDLLMGRIKVPVGDPIVDKEWSVLQWEDEARRVEDPRLPNHKSDAFLYAWRESRHYHHVPETPPPAPGTPEHNEMVEQEMLQEAIAAEVGKPGETWWERE